MIPEDFKLHIRPIPFKSDDLTKFNTEKIQKEMENLGLRPKDLVKLLCIDKSTISQILSSDRNLSRPSKAMFYYLFKYLKAKVNV
jgi:transcriptional regulator with XRE-family HTH domain